MTRRRTCLWKRIWPKKLETSTYYKIFCFANVHLIRTSSVTLYKCDSTKWWIFLFTWWEEVWTTAYLQLQYFEFAMYGMLWTSFEGHPIYIYIRVNYFWYYKSNCVISQIICVYAEHQIPGNINKNETCILKTGFHQTFSCFIHNISHFIYLLI